MIGVTEHANMEDEELHFKGATIRQREDGLFEVRFRRFNQNLSFYGKELKTAKSKFNTWYDFEFKKKKQLPAAKQVTVNDFLITYYEHFKKPYVTDRTLKDIQLKIKKYIVPFIGTFSISQVSALDIQKILNNATYNGRPQNKVNTYLKEIFKTAVNLKLIKEDPTINSKFKRTKDVHSTALSKEEQKQLKTNIQNTPLEKFYLFLLYSGCRRSEALNFKLEDINKETNTIHIKGTKTEKSDRVIPFFNGLKEILKNCKNNQVFKNLSQAQVTRNFKNFCPNHTLRDLRKTFATNCYELGVAPKVVQKWLGHSKVNMTLDIYTDVTKDFEQKELEKLKF